jgi:hypothetical protein
MSLASHGTKNFLIFLLPVMVKSTIPDNMKGWSLAGL